LLKYLCRHVGRYIGHAYGKGYGVIWLTDIECIGNESEFSKCQLSYRGDRRCYHFEDVSISCEPAVNGT